MGKFYGKIGFAESEEASSGVWVDTITDRLYYGDILKNVSKVNEGENLNDNLTVENRLSILADPYAYKKFYTMRYVEWMGTKWKIISVDVKSPRLILKIGGVYNGDETTVADDT